MKKFYSEDFVLGILGGGQLGRMLIQEAINYDVRVAVLDPAEDCPCAKIAHFFQKGDFNDFDTVYAFGKDKDVLTIEIEHVNVDALERLESEGKIIYPRPSFLRMVKDKGLQKAFYQNNDIATSPFRLYENAGEMRKSEAHFPFVQKLRTGGYDGKGVQVIRHEDDLSRAFDAPCIAEDLVKFNKEIAVIISRNLNGEIATFPIVEMEFNQEANLVEFLFSPAQISEDVSAQAIKLAHQIVEASDFVGLLAVEMFVDDEGRVVVNEMAPRPHNSGHHTIEACITSQYEQFLRSILNLPPGDTSLLTPAVMINLLGEKGYSGPVVYEGLENLLHQAGVSVHLYGKPETRPFRKMGHITITASDLRDAQQKARATASGIRVISC